MKVFEIVIVVVSLTMAPKGLGKNWGTGVRGRFETMVTTELLKLAWMFRRVLEIWEISDFRENS